MIYRVIYFRGVLKPITKSPGIRIIKMGMAIKPLHSSLYISKIRGIDCSLYETSHHLSEPNSISLTPTPLDPS